jgi:trehalose 6-phosphate synthase/phosphatase
MAGTRQPGGEPSVFERLRLIRAGRDRREGALDKAAPVEARPERGLSPGPRLICVSHREPFARAKVGRAGSLERTTGGLVTALDSALRDIGGRWIASGEADAHLKAPPDSQGRTYDIDQIGLSTREMDQYYSGFSNRVLWPLFHYFIGRMLFKPDEWHQYAHVNRRFADALVKAMGTGDSVAWIHDYQLLLVPNLVRHQRPQATLGLFLHIPFPAYEVFRTLPTRREILIGMLGADVIGFHTSHYRDAFLDSARQLLGARVDKYGAVDYAGHRSRTIASPIGIDVAKQTELATDPRTVAKALRLRKSIHGDMLILGVDRLDYSKGIIERFAGFERLLERHPEHRGRTTLVQIAVPSRTRVEEYRQLKRATDEAVGRINGKYGDGVWTPVQYITHSVQAAELAAYYRAADVALVTPLRDGLNLVAKEYVASRVDFGGALVLSEFAGASEELPQAYIVNPYGPDSISDALHAALTDDRVERERRMMALHARVQTNDVNQWARGFFEQLKRQVH